MLTLNRPTLLKKLTQTNTQTNRIDFEFLFYKFITKNKMKASLSVQAIHSIQDSYSYTHTYMYTEGNYNKILFKN